MLHQAPMLPGAPLSARVLRLEQMLAVFEGLWGTTWKRCLSEGREKLEADRNNSLRYSAID